MTRIQNINDNLQWRVIGTWSFTDTDGEEMKGNINYGFSTQDAAMSYMKLLLNIAINNNLDYHTELGWLQVKADKWGNMNCFNGSYRVASYLTEN